MNKASRIVINGFLTLYYKMLYVSPIFFNCKLSLLNVKIQVRFFEKFWIWITNIPWFCKRKPYMVCNQKNSTKITYCFTESVQFWKVLYFLDYPLQYFFATFFSTCAAHLDMNISWATSLKFRVISAKDVTSGGKQVRFNPKFYLAAEQAESEKSIVCL